MNKKEARNKLLLRREVAKSRLLEIGVIHKPLLKFNKKYPEIEYKQLRRFWYSSSISLEFVVKLEAFVSFCENEY